MFNICKTNGPTLRNAPEREPAKSESLHFTSTLFALTAYISSAHAKWLTLTKLQGLWRLTVL